MRVTVSGQNFTFDLDVLDLPTNEVTREALAFVAGLAERDRIERERRAAIKYQVVLLRHGDRKIDCIKEIRTAYGMSLKDAKDASESTGIVLGEHYSPNDAIAIAAALRATGATVDIVTKGVS